MLRRAVALGVLVSVGAVGARAQAEEKVPEASRAPSYEERAEDSFNRAITAYGANDKASALRLMAEAYRLSPHAELLYDLAKLEQELGRCKEALDHYRQYVSRAPNGALTELASRSVKSLQKECGERTTTYFNPVRIVAWSAIGTGVAAGIGAVYFAMASKAAESDVEHMVREGGNAYESRGGPAREMDGRRDNTLATVFAATSGTLVAGGAVLLFFGSPRKERTPSSLSVGMTRGGSAFVYSGSF